MVLIERITNVVEENSTRKNMKVCEGYIIEDAITVTEKAVKAARTPV